MLELVFLFEIEFSIDGGCDIGYSDALSGDFSCTNAMAYFKDE